MSFSDFSFIFMTLKKKKGRRKDLPALNYPSTHKEYKKSDSYSKQIIQTYSIHVVCIFNESIVYLIATRIIDGFYRVMQRNHDRSTSPVVLRICKTSLMHINTLLPFKCDGVTSFPGDGISDISVISGWV